MIWWIMKIEESAYVISPSKISIILHKIIIQKPSYYSLLQYFLDENKPQPS